MNIKLPEISDALNPLPRLKSLVITEIESFGRKTPIDNKVFGISFAGSFTLLLLIAFLLPLLFSTQKDVQHHAEEKAATVSAVQSGYQPFDAATLTERQKSAITNNQSRLNEPLIVAPIEALEEPVGNGAIPRISDDGRKPSFVYSRPYDKADPRPTITIVLADLGLSRLLTEAAITDFPGAITLTFSNFSPAAEAWMARARSLGHEVLLSVPMEPLDFPISDPGPGTLLTKNTVSQNKALLLKHLANGKGFLGLTTFSGSRFTTSPEKLKPVLAELNKRGLIWLDAHLTPLSSGAALAKEIQMPSAKADISIDEDMGSLQINQAFKDAEETAQKGGHSVLLAQVTPLSIAMFKEWIKTLPSKNISLAPISAIVE